MCVCVCVCEHIYLKGMCADESGNLNHQEFSQRLCDVDKFQHPDSESVHLHVLSFAWKSQ